ncbi:hypothetical protein M422DRAFT_191237, partial [Sphaerobolus stellatus SS14]
PPPMSPTAAISAPPPHSSLCRSCPRAMLGGSKASQHRSPVFSPPPAFTAPPCCRQ